MTKRQYTISEICQNQCYNNYCNSEEEPNPTNNLAEFERVI